MRGAQGWWLGLGLLAAFVAASELAVVFAGHVFGRLGLSRDLVLSLLWLLPALAACLAEYSSQRQPLLAGLSYVPVLTVVGPAVHYLAGEFGATVDLGGLAGLKVTLGIYFFLSLLTVGAGAAVGWLLRRRKGIGA